MELKEGMYIRTEEGEISKIEWITFQRWEGLENTVKATFWLENNERLEYPRDNFKASFNLIDLIKVGDYVNGVKVTEIKDGKPYHEDYNDPYFSYYFEENNIKDIVTKEQFNACKYVVERNK